MNQGRRGVDNDFRSTDYLYQRFGAEDFSGDRLLAPRLEYFNQSVNWSKYSAPWDVAFQNRDKGIARIKVSDLPHLLPQNLPKNAKYHQFNPAHDPLPENYSHSEIRVFKDGVRLTSSGQVGTLAKKEYRTMISDKLTILLYPPA